MDWNIVVMSETWLERGEWERLRGRMPKEFRWEVQLANRKSKKERVIGGMLMGIRKGIEIIEGKGGREMDGMMMRMLKLGEEK